VDISKYAADFVRRRCGVDVVHGSIDDARFPDASFDVVHMSHVLEHLADPLGNLRTIGRLLRPGGCLIVEVPNEFDNLYTWVRLRSATAHAYDVPSTHLWFFTPASLARVIRSAGFAVRRLHTFRDTEDPRVVRRIGKRVAGRIEALVGRGPLIEAVADWSRTA
jgi:SAM-dependent methyltransferase